MLKIGDVFYIGSTSSLGRRRSDHLDRLKNGTHHAPKLQQAFNAGGPVEFLVIQEIQWKPRESRHELRRRLWLHEQILLDAHFGTENCANQSEKANFNTARNKEKHAARMRQLWQTPEYRNRVIRKKHNPSAETREKMAAAKRGAKHPAARACKVTLNGKTLRFPTTQDAATHFGVTQQSMHAWISGKTPWPGQGRFVRKQTQHLVGATGGFVD